MAAMGWVDATLTADGSIASYHSGLSLLQSWFPATIQVVAVVVVLFGIGRRSRRWLTVRLPLCVLLGVLAASCIHWYANFQGMGDNPALPIFWLWVGLSGFAIAGAVLGWRATRWWRRVVSLFAVLLCVLSCGITLNLSVRYFTTVPMAWNELTAGSLPDQVGLGTVEALQQGHSVPPRGTIVPVEISSEMSKFRHRTEFVYLPPAWYSTDPPPPLPTVMMIGGQFNTPADWIRQGDAVNTIDQFAAAHHGNAPVFVFVDTGGSFNNDTECVNGPRGKAADHLTGDIAPFMKSRFGVRLDSAGWGIVGFSMGGTCAVDITVMHPDLSSSFVDISGDLSPAAGTREQTITRLFGGDAAAAADFDPINVMTKHGPYRGVSGWFAVASVSQAGSGSHRLFNPSNHDSAAREREAADRLCAVGKSEGISCAVVAKPGQHDWSFAKETFISTLPWLAGQIGTPLVPRRPLPGITDAAHAISAPVGNGYGDPTSVGGK